MKKQALQVFLIICLCWKYAAAQTPIDMTPTLPLNTTPYTSASYTPVAYSPASYTTSTHPEEDTTDYHPIIAQFVEEKAVPGDIVTLKLSFQLPKGMTFPEKIPIQGLDEFQIMGMDTDGSDILIRLMVDVIDTFDVPALKVFLTHANGTPMAFKSDPVMLTVDLPFDKTDTEIDVHPIKDIIPVNTTQQYLVWAAIALILLMIGLGIWFFIRKRKQKIIEEQRQKTPEEIAFDALRDLNRDAHLFRDNIKAFYFRLTQILKEYMGQIRGFPAAELTTEEIASKIKKDADIEMVRLMRKADMIKFADFRPTTAEREDHWKTIWSYVKTTSDERHQQLEETN
ncbi:MAG: hypothetical protein HQK75_13835 [Candidatus Magnetomorum sp.]|nr:hypothetical protein [Candidatus Magnetomorum sp.]